MFAATCALFAPVGALGIVDGYALDGTPMPANPGGKSASFIGPAAVGAMGAPAQRAFVTDAYAALASGSLTAGGRYYEESWTLLSLLMLSGNFVDYTQIDQLSTN